MPRLDKLTLGVSPLTERIYVGTIKSDNGKVAEWREKRDISNDFYRAVIEWCPPGFEREITDSDGVRIRIRAERLDPINP